MKRAGFILSHFISAFVVMILLNNCAVIKTPYLKTGYYQKTISRLDSLKTIMSCIDDSIYAGFSRISITPDLNNFIENPEEGRLNKVPIAGFGQIRERVAKGIHDSVFVKAVALKSGQQRVVLVGADLLIMPPNIIDSVTSILAKAGIQRDELFFSATHTHSGIGGWGYGLLGNLIAGEENKNLELWLIKQITKAVFGAISDLHPARLGSGSFNAAPYTRNRLTGNPLDKNDEFDFVVVEQTGLRKAIIGSFSAHATTIGSKNRLISADYPGYWERKTEGAAADLALFCGGSMGSQSPVGQGDDFESAMYIGEALADSLASHLKNVIMHEKQTLSSLSLKMYLPEYHMRLTMHTNLSTGLSNRLMPFPKNVYLQALRINNLIWFFTPGDFSGESALLIKKSLEGKGYQAFVSGYDGSYIGYIIPGKYFYLDNYESKGMGWFGPTMGDYMMELIDRMSNALILNSGNNK
jgi:neutral ceramidase